MVRDRASYYNCKNLAIISMSSSIYFTIIVLYISTKPSNNTIKLFLAQGHLVLQLAKDIL